MYSPYYSTPSRSTAAASVDPPKMSNGDPHACLEGPTLGRARGPMRRERYQAFTPHDDFRYEWYEALTFLYTNELTCHEVGIHRRRKQNSSWMQIVRRARASFVTYSWDPSPALGPSRLTRDQRFETRTLRARSDWIQTGYFQRGNMWSRVG